MNELKNQKRGTRAAVIGSAAGLIPAISLAFYWFLSQEPNVAAQRVGYVAWALLLLSPYVLALVASRVREPGVRGGLLLGVGLLSLVGSFSTFSLIVGNQRKWDTLRPERLEIGRGLGELPEGLVVASSPF